jgi:hypothetical protein
LSNSPLLVGSGQSGIPWERMQPAKASASPNAPFCAVVVEEVTLEEPPPPQPDASSANAATATIEATMS